MPKRPYPRYRHRHNAVLLAACRDPSQTQKEIAKATGYSPSQVSRILCSPEFQQVYAGLIKEIAVEARSEWLTRVSATRGEEPFSIKLRFTRLSCA